MKDTVKNYLADLVGKGGGALPTQIPFLLTEIDIVRQLVAVVFDHLP